MFFFSSDDPESRYKSDYRGPQEDTRETQVAVLKYFGFFTSFQINRLFKTFRYSKRPGKAMNLLKQ